MRTFKEYVGESDIMGILLMFFVVRNLVRLSGERVTERDASQVANLPQILCEHAIHIEKCTRTVDLDPSAATTYIA